MIIMFVGNDFIPRLPTFEIREGGIDYMIQLYKQKWPQVGYLSRNGVIFWKALNEYLQDFPSYETEVLRKRFTSKN